MRCDECRVDVGESATYCPLCGGALATDAPLIDQQNEAPYPAIRYKKPYRTVTAIYYAIYLVVVALAALIEKLVSGEFKITFICALVLPAAWSLIVRPLAKRYLNVGIYLMMNMLTLSPLILFFTYVSKKAFSLYLPAMAGVVTTVLIVYALVAKKRRYDCTSYFIITFLYSVLLIIAAWVTHTSVTLPLLSAALSVLCAVLLLAMDRRKFTDELRARFHF